MAAGGSDVSRQLLMHALMDGEETSVLCVRRACALCGAAELFNVSQAWTAAQKLRRLAKVNRPRGLRARG